MILMNKEEINEKKIKYFILDSTAIIHFSLTEETQLENSQILLPEDIKNEIKSTQSRTALELIESDDQVVYTHPTTESIERIVSIAKKTGDSSSLSEIDIQVLALSLDYPNSTLISDDNAIQNVCSFSDINFKPTHFRIKTSREYFWKCKGCGEKYSTKISICPECGNIVKRYYIKKDRI